MRRDWIAIVFLFAAAVGSASAETETFEASRPYCGVLSVYAAAAVEGIDVELAGLLKPEFVGCVRGSSMPEVAGAAARVGLWSRSYGNLTTGFLERSPYPVILHVRSSANAPDYDHYVVAVGAADDGSGVRVIDPNEPTRVWRNDEFAKRWDGVGILVARRPVNRLRSEGWQWAGVLPWAPLLLVVLLFARWWDREGLRDSLSIRPPLRLFVTTCALLAACTTASAAYHLVSPMGLWRKGGVAKEADRRHRGDFLHAASISEVRDAARSGAHGTFIIDARYAEDYAAGHVPGALSVPPNAGSDWFANHAPMIPKDAAVIVYCQSPGCPFSDRVAARLLDAGYGRVSIFRGGWEAWAKATQSPR